MMNLVKAIIKRTYFFQFVREFNEYIRRCSFQRKIGNFEKIKMMAKYRIIKEIKPGNKGKLIQINSLLNTVKIDTDLKYGYFYSIDENVSIYNSGTVIDNMPCDYSFLISHSLNDMKGMGCEKAIKQNKEYLNIIEKYIIKVISLLKKEGKEDAAILIENIINEPASDLKDALQRILFWNQILWQTNHHLVGLGRLDKILDKYNVEEDSEIAIKNFLLAIHSHYLFKSSAMPGDTGQVIVLGGDEINEEYFYNKYTILFLKILTEMKLPDPKVVLRISSKTPDEILKLAIDSISLGIGSPLLSNDEVIIPAMQDFGYDVEDSFDYSVSACWEPLPSKDSLEQNNLITLDLGKVLTNVIHDDNVYKIQSIDEFLDLFKYKMTDEIKNVCQYVNSINWNNDPLMTLCSKSCRESGMTISEGGVKNKNYGFLTVGMSSVVNTIINLQQYVFKEEKYTISELINAVRNNFNDYEFLIDDLKDCKHKFGSDSKEAIRFTNIIIDQIYNIIRDYRNIYGGKIKFGLSSPAYIMLGKNVDSTLDGRKRGEPFTTHISNESNESITELVLFASKLDYFKQSLNGNVVDIMLQPSLIRDNKEKFLTFIKSSVKVGFFQMQFNVLDSKQLIEAKKHPEKYPQLIVRVWGFSAYFNDLSDDYKDLLISRAIKNENAA